MRNGMFSPRTLVPGLFFKAAVGLAVLIAVALLSTSTTFAVYPNASMTNSAVNYIEAAQNTDGGFPSFGTDSDAGSTLDAVFALKSAGINPLTVTKGGNSPRDFLASQASTYSGTAGGAAKLSLGVSLMGLNPASFASLNLYSVMASYYNSSTGDYGDDNFDAAFYIMALKAANQAIPGAAVSHLESLQSGEGGWEFCCSMGDDTNSTAIIVQALVAAGVPLTDTHITHAMSWLQTQQNSDGGFGYQQPFNDTDPSSTAFVMQALLSTRQDIDEGGIWAPGGNTPMEGLATQYDSGTGAFEYFGADSVFSTYQAIPAAEMAPFPSFVSTPDGCTGFTPPWPLTFDDKDCDGFPDSIQAGSLAPESFIGTSPTVRCAATPALNDEGGIDAWPMDFNDDQKVNLSDVLHYSAVFNTTVGGPPGTGGGTYAKRYDLNGDNKIDLSDILHFSPFFNKTCA